MLAKIQVMLIKDDDATASSVQTAPGENVYRTPHAVNDKNGLVLTEANCPNDVLLDLGLPDDDYEVLRKQPTCFTFPLTITSSRSDGQDKINSLDEGTDNHTARPYKPAELMAGIRSFLQYISVKNPDGLYRAQGLEINFEKRRIQLNGRAVHLTPIEYQIITLLAKDSGKVLTYEVIMRTIWGPYCGDDNEILRVHMTNIRRKIEPQSPQFQYVFTEPGIGYRMLENEVCYGFTVNEANISHISSSVK